MYVCVCVCTRKTKILAICPSDYHSDLPREVWLKPDEEPVKVVKEFEYLGSIISHDCTLDKEINSCISKASYVFQSLFRVLWSRKRLKVTTKIHLFKSVVLPTLLYGSETWVPLVTHMHKAFTGLCYGVHVRAILGVSQWDQERNTELHSGTGLDRVEVMIMRRRLRWLGHVERMNDTCIPKCMSSCMECQMRQFKRCITLEQTAFLRMFPSTFPRTSPKVFRTTPFLLLLMFHYSMIPYTQQSFLYFTAQVNT